MAMGWQVVNIIDLKLEATAFLVEEGQRLGSDCKSTYLKIMLNLTYCLESVNIQEAINLIHPYLRASKMF